MSHDTHRHRCPRCAFVWEHSNKTLMDELLTSTQEYNERHRCPNCDYWRFDGDESQSTHLRYDGAVPAGEFDMVFALTLPQLVVEQVPSDDEPRRLMARLRTENLDRAHGSQE